MYRNNVYKMPTTRYDVDGVRVESAKLDTPKALL
jgi:hypothetical protein